MTKSTQIPQTTDESADLVSASESSTSFWDNPLDEEDWHRTPPTLASDGELEGLLHSHMLRFQRLLARSRESIRQGKGLSQEDFWNAVAERREGDTEATHEPTAA